MSDGAITTGNISGVGVAIGHGAQVLIYGDIHYYPISLRAPLRQRFDPLIEDRAHVFGGRTDAFTRIAEVLQQPTGSVLVITAPAGFGKTALLANLVKQTPEAFAYHFFTSLYGGSDGRDSSLSETFFLRNVVEQMAQWHGSTEPTPHDLDELRALYHQFLSKPLDRTRILVLDGLDEVTTWKLAPYLSRPIPDGLHLILSIRDTGQNWQHEYSLPIDQVIHLALDGLQSEDLRQLLSKAGTNGMLIAQDTTLLEQLMRAAAYEGDLTQGADPFYVRLLVEDVAQSHLTPAQVAQQPQGLNAYLDRWWQEIRQQANNEALRDLFGTLTVALGPIAQNDLEAINPSLVDPWEKDYVLTLLSQVRRFVFGDENQGYSLVHPRLQSYLLQKIKINPYREKILDYGATWYADRSKPLSNYLRQFWIAHLREVGDWKQIRIVLTDIVLSSDAKHYLQPWQTACFAADGSDTAYLTDLNMLWMWAEEQNDLTLMFRCALIATSLRSRSDNLNPKLLIQLVQVGTPEGKWSPAAILEQIAHMTEPFNQAGYIQVILDSGICLPWDRALEIASSITHQLARSKALTDLALHLPSDFLTEAFQAIFSISDASIRAQALTQLVLLLHSDYREILLVEALSTIQNIPDEWGRAVAYMALRHFLSPDQYRGASNLALHATEALSNEAMRAHALINIVYLLPTNLLHQALHIASAIFNSESRVKALTALVPLLPTNQQEVIIADALRTAHTISDQVGHVKALIGLAPLLPSDQQNALLVEVLKAVQKIVNQKSQVEALMLLVSVLPPDLHTEVLKIVRTFSDQDSCAKVLTGLAPLLSSNLHSEVLEIARTFSDQDSRAKVLTVLAPLVSLDNQTTILVEALHAARAIKYDSNRAVALSALVPLLHHTQQRDIVAESLRAAQNISDQESRVNALTVLMPFLSLRQQRVVLREVFHSTQAITYDSNRALALCALIPFLPSDQQRGVLAEILHSSHTLSDQERRTKILMNLVPFLPLDIQKLIIAELSCSAQNISNLENRIKSQIALVSFLPPDQQRDVLADVLKVIYTITSDSDRVLALLNLLPVLPPDKQTDVLADALEAIHTITSDSDRVLVLSNLLPFLPPDQQTDVLADVLEATFTNPYSPNRTQLLKAVAPILVLKTFYDPLFPQTLRICADRGRSQLLSDIADLTPWFIAIAQRAQQPKVIEELATAIIETARCWP
jgi:hypothetical protein